MSVGNERLIAQLKRHEGLSLKAYRCPAGKLTIGYGHNLDAKPVPGLNELSEINEDQAGRLLIADVRDATRETLDAFRWAAMLDETRLCVLVNMAFNLGVGRLCGFTRFLEALSVGDYETAATEMLDSKWADQVKHRALELSMQMRTGEWR